MGYIAHDAVIATMHFGEAPDIDAFRKSLPDEFRHLVIGPIASVVNDHPSFAFLPDGSKEGWGDSDLGDEFRQQFIELFRHVEGRADVVSVRFGGDFGVEIGVRTRDEINEEVGL